MVASHVPVVMYGQAVNGLSSQNFASQAVARADLGGGGKGAMPPRCQTLCNMTLKQHNPGVHCNKNATNGIKLGLSFSPGL